MHGFDTTIHLASLRRDELLQSAAEQRTARRVARRRARRHAFPGRSA